MSEHSTKWQSKTTHSLFVFYPLWYDIFVVNRFDESDVFTFEFIQGEVNTSFSFCGGQKIVSLSKNSYI